MKKIEYEREPKVEEEPDQYRKLNDEPKVAATTKKDTNILMNAASLIPKGSEMYVHSKNLNINRAHLQVPSHLPVSTTKGR